MLVGCCAFFAAWLVCLQPAFADQLTIAPSADATLYEESANSSGKGQYLFVGSTRIGLRRRALIAFDIAKALPRGTVITQVALTIHVSRTIAGPKEVALHRVRAAWGEGSSNPKTQEGAGVPASEGDVTWQERQYKQAAWKSPGGDFDAEASATRSVDEAGSYTFSEAGLVQDATDWLDDPSSNFGWIMLAETGEGISAKRFDSREFLGSTRPTLTLTYEPPLTPAGACCDGVGGCGIRFDAQSCDGSLAALGTRCDPNPCPPLVGACCSPDLAGTCVERSLEACAESMGTWRGPGVACAPNPCPPALEPFVDPLPVPPLATPDASTGDGEHYRITMVQTQQKLHRDLPATTVWAYGDGHYTGYPGPTIQAQVDRPVKVTWVNDLRDTQGNLREHHILPVDDCVHGAHHDAPRTVVHLHGAHVPSAYDGQPEQTLLPGQEATYEYPNHQEAATLWYHDHAIGITRLNVYMGLAGFYWLRDPEEDALGLPAGEYEIPLVLQDRSVTADGQLAYPKKWDAHFFGDQALVNGKIWPYLDVKRGMYRFRVVNGSGSRTYLLSLSKSHPMTVIGSDGGLLPKPVQLTKLALSPGERVELVVDFSRHLPGEVVYLFNSADTPYPNGGLPHPLPQLMMFRVGSEAGHSAPLPEVLRPRRELLESSAALSRDFVLANQPNECSGTMWLINGKTFDEITERPVLGTTEIWRFYNPSHLTHPMHMHLVMFQVLDRQSIEETTSDHQHDTPVATPMLTGERRSPRPEESGWKDTVQVGPMEMVRVIAQFTDYEGRYSYHCHILEHEDQAMMRQFETVAPGSQLDGGPAGLDMDSGTPDASGDPVPSLHGQGGCGCSTLPTSGHVGLGWLSWCVACMTWRWRRRRL